MSRRRSEFPGKIRAAAFERAKGCCEECGVSIRPGNGPEYDHRIPDALGGEPTLDNCAVLCRSCHGAKTAKEDVPRIAKAKRVQRGHINAKPKPTRPIPGSRNHHLKRKVGGGTVPRWKD
ncbi:endonuclease [Pararhodobacter marinus]|uniref:Endonuclease n=1 Tax=Pararhodobacter marinus TaxID=2184063 RepID=A0A2U2C4B6_9RHOB|nr:HNH endonuclease signature motif containing protein [Pararhodobacter marinus]PWE26689.1 endonuclease [Pararhodobacter marinus]